MDVTYASPRLAGKIELWNELKSLQIAPPWCIVGDFNSVMCSDERSPPGKSLACFQKWMHTKSLIDHGFNGPKYTWSRGDDIQQRMARFDKAFSNMNWQWMFPEASVMHCPHFYSDHYPILIRTRSTNPVMLGKRPFRFEVAWLLHWDFISFTEKNWKKGGRLLDITKKLIDKLRMWNKKISATLENARKDW